GVRDAPSAIWACATEGARHGARMPHPRGRASSLSAGAATVRALRRRERYRFNLLPYGAAARSGRALRRAARTRGPTRGAPPSQRSHVGRTRGSAFGGHQRARTSRARQAGRLRRTASARLERALEEIADQRAAGDGPARGVAGGPTATGRVETDIAPRRLQTRQRDAGRPRCRAPRRSVRLGDERRWRSAGGFGNSARLLDTCRPGITARCADVDNTPRGLVHARRDARTLRGAHR